MFVADCKTLLNASAVEVVHQPPMVTAHFSGFDEKTPITFTQLQDILDLRDDVSVVRQTLNFTMSPQRTVSVMFCRTRTRRPLEGTLVEKTVRPKAMKRGRVDAQEEARTKAMSEVVAKAGFAVKLSNTDRDNLITLLVIAASLSDNPPLSVVYACGEIDDRHTYISCQGYPEVDALRLKAFVDVLPYHVADVFVDVHTGRISVSVIRASVQSALRWKY